MPDWIRLESRVLEGTTPCRYALQLPVSEQKVS